MAILNNNPLVGASGNQGGYNINNSLRSRGSASAYLSRTPSSAGNRKTWTWSAWVKRGQLGTFQTLFCAGPSDAVSPFETRFRFNDTDTLALTINGNGATGGSATTTAVFRDPSAWYHIVAYVDMAASGQANKVRIYVNNVLQTVTYSLLSTTDDTQVNNNVIHRINANSFALSGFADNYLAEVNLIDGQALTPSSFGETDTTTGVWKPKAYTGTYGTNGFYLKFSDIATTSGSNAGLGKDFSGNANYWTTNNISVTSGTTYDAMKDVPTNTSATVANYAVLNPLTLRSGTGTVSVTTSNANLTWNFQTSGASPQNYMVSGTIGMSSGKWYWEMTPTTITATTGLNIGIGANPYSSTNFWATDGNSTEYFYVSNSGNKGNNGSSVAYGSSYTVNDVIGVALDMDAGTLTFYKNNVSQGTAFTGLTGTYFPFIACPSSAATDVVQVNFGQRPFTYTPPTGYVALNTYNLPTPTILQGNKYMDATLWAGNSATGTVIVNQAQFKPDFVWVKNRTNSVGGFHNVFDSVRGINKRLFTNDTQVEDTNSDTLQAFNSNGFTVGTNSNVNASASNYVGWQWQAGQGSTSSNTSGSITSTVSVNTTAGFSVVTYTGNGTIGATVGHGLGVAPSMIIVKQRNSTESWATYHKSLGATQYLNLNQTMAAATSITRWNNTTPSSTVITFYNDAVSNGSGSTYVAYCWADVSGYSKAFSYTGNGSTDGPFTYLGFRPKFILIKNASGGATSSLQGWIMLDTSRSTYNVTADALFANNSNASSSSSTYGIDILSNGFKTRGTDGAVNESSATYIGIAFASNPFKNSLAR